MNRLRYRHWLLERAYHAWRILRGQEIPSPYYLPSIHTSRDTIIEHRRGWVLVEREESS